MIDQLNMRLDRFTVANATRPRLRLSLVLLLLGLGLAVGWPRAGIANNAGRGALVLVGDVLRYNHPQIWKRICELADRDLSDLTIIATASSRPKLYGSFAKRALERCGVFAEVAPVAINADEFGVPYQQAVSDPALVNKLQRANGVFFVGGAPQHLARALFRADGSPTPMAEAIARVHAAGGLVVGGIPGPAGVRTGIDAMDALERGRFHEHDLYRGLGLIAEGWYVDQHFFTAGRFAEVLVAMRQLGFTYGLGVGVDTAAVIESNRIEVVGDEGVMVVDLSMTMPGDAGDAGFSLKGARLSYLDDGDVLDMATGKAIPSPEKLDDFEMRPNRESDPQSVKHGAVVENVFAKGRLVQLLRETLDGGSNQATGLAFHHGAGGHERGFRFRFYTGPDSVGWLSPRSGAERLTILNIHLDIEPLTRK